MNTIPLPDKPEGDLLKALGIALIASLVVTSCHSHQAVQRKERRPEAYRRDVPGAFVHVLDAGHFALDTAADEIAALLRGFVPIHADAIKE